MPGSDRNGSQGREWNHGENSNCRWQRGTGHPAEKDPGGWIRNNGGADTDRRPEICQWKRWFFFNPDGRGYAGDGRFYAAEEASGGGCYPADTRDPHHQPFRHWERAVRADARGGGLYCQTVPPDDCKGAGANPYQAV